MVVPDYQSLMVPLLKAIGDGQEHGLSEVTESLAKQFRLTDADRAVLLPSGRQRKFDNRVGWARTYMRKAGLLDITGVGRIKILPRGLEVLEKNLSKIDRRFLMQFPEFVEFQKHEETGETDKGPSVIQPETPTEILQSNYRIMKTTLEDELLERVKKCSPKFFEKLVLDLLVAMGYGGSRKDAEAVGRSGDGGIDGVIKEDKLGLDVVYVQAKRWQGNVGERPLRDFSGGLDPHKASKGVFITTSRFTPEAYEYVKKIGKTIVLIDGLKLAQLMFEYGVGATEVDSFSVKQADSDYFEGEQ